MYFFIHVCLFIGLFVYLCVSSSLTQKSVSKFNYIIAVLKIYLKLNTVTSAACGYPF